MSFEGYYQNSGLNVSSLLKEYRELYPYCLCVDEYVIVPTLPQRKGCTWCQLWHLEQRWIQSLSNSYGIGDTETIAQINHRLTQVTTDRLTYERNTDSEKQRQREAYRLRFEESERLRKIEDDEVEKWLSSQ